MKSESLKGRKDRRRANLTKALRFFGQVRNVERQNVERQNVERQNVERQNGERQNGDLDGTSLDE
jgi:hypothetical protein